MKKIILFVSGIFAILVLTAFWASVSNATSFVDLTFQGKTNKESYLIGEPVKLEFKFVNTGLRPVDVPSGGVEVGSLRVLIGSERNGKYNDYRGPGWGVKRGRRMELAPGDAYAYKEAIVLWSGKPQVSHLNEDAACVALEGRIPTDYAFEAPGVYWVKGLSYVGTDLKPVESEPFRIEIKEPVEENAGAWNRIKGNREIALLMQTGSFDTTNDATKQTLISEVEQILLDYPESTYSAYLRPNLQKYKGDEIRRKEWLENALKSQKKP
ncbi:MAG: hypothetical protein QM785_15860 [Pyrinomonadaceae bacterium]